MGGVVPNVVGAPASSSSAPQAATLDGELLLFFFENNNSLEKFFSNAKIISTNKKLPPQNDICYLTFFRKGEEPEGSDRGHRRERRQGEDECELGNSEGEYHQTLGTHLRKIDAHLNLLLAIK